VQDLAPKSARKLGKLLGEMPVDGAGTVDIAHALVAIGHEAKSLGIGMDLGFFPLGELIHDVLELGRNPRTGRLAGEVEIQVIADILDRGNVGEIAECQGKEARFGRFESEFAETIDKTEAKLIEGLEVNEGSVFVEELVPAIRNFLDCRLIGARAIGLLDPGEPEFEHALHEKLGTHLPRLAVVEELLNGGDALFDPTEFHERTSIAQLEAVANLRQLLLRGIPGDIFVVEANRLAMVAELCFTETKLETGDVLAGVGRLHRRLDIDGGLGGIETISEGFFGVLPSLLRQQGHAVVEDDPAGLGAVVFEERLESAREIKESFEGFRRFRGLTGHVLLDGFAVKSLDAGVFFILGIGRAHCREREENPEHRNHAERKFYEISFHSEENREEIWKGPPGVGAFSLAVSKRDAKLTLFLANNAKQPNLTEGRE